MYKSWARQVLGSASLGKSRQVGDDKKSMIYKSWAKQVLH
jgi:hypothetical protein